VDALGPEAVVAADGIHSAVRSALFGAVQEVANDPASLPTRQAQLTFAMARHAAVDLVQVLDVKPGSLEPPRLPSAMEAQLRQDLTDAGFGLRDSQSANERLTELRAMYEPYVYSLSTFLHMPLPEWNPDKANDSIEAQSERTWIDFTRWYRGGGRGNSGTQPAGRAAYAQTTIISPRERKVVLRLGFDDWMKVGLNDGPAKTFRHDEGFAVADVPFVLREGKNQLRIKLSNSDNVQWRCWAFSCVIAEDNPAGEHKPLPVEPQMNTGVAG